MRYGAGKPNCRQGWDHVQSRGSKEKDETPFNIQELKELFEIDFLSSTKHIFYLLFKNQTPLILKNQTPFYLFIIYLFIYYDMPTE